MTAVYKGTTSKPALSAVEGCRKCRKINGDFSPWGTQDSDNDLLRGSLKMHFHNPGDLI